MSLDDLPTRAPQPGADSEPAVRRVDRPSPQRDKVTRAEELRVLSYAGNPDRFHEVNERFHNAIYAGSQNGYIAEMTLATRVRVHPFRRAQFRNLGRLAKSHAEHDRVVVAIMRGDKAGAASAMRAHIELVRGEYELYAVSV